MNNFAAARRNLIDSPPLIDTPLIDTPPPLRGQKFNNPPGALLEALRYIYLPGYITNISHFHIYISHDILSSSLFLCLLFQT